MNSRRREFGATSEGSIASKYSTARSNVNEGSALRFKGTWMRLTRRAVRDYNFRGTRPR